MCGIAAIVASRGPIEPGLVARALAAMDHRGPDGRGAWRDRDGRVALGHARLAVTSPADGAQPIAGEDGRIHIVVNGEFYGHRDARRGLEQRGHVFRTASDSEVALHAYEELGAGFARQLRGEFALCLWDARTRTLVAARDRFGVKPLLFAEHDGALYVASTARALFAMGVPAAWDAAAFYQAACAQYALPGRTLFRGVREVPPGHLLLARDGALSLVADRDLDLPLARPADCDDAPARIAQLGRALERAVAERFEADAPACVQLSGGLDSSAVAALAARARGGPIDCFTVGFADAPAGYDERPVARETCAHLGARLHEVALDEAALFEAFEPAVVAGEGLVINAHAPAKFLLSRAMHARGFKVVLTGEGADELFAGYAHLRADLANARGVDASARLDRTNAASAGVMLAPRDAPSLPLDAVRARLGFVPTWMVAKAALGHRTLGIVAPSLRARFAGHDAFGAIVDAFDHDGQLRGRHPVDVASYLWSRQALAGYILRTLGDGMEMAHSVEGRVPFLDDGVLDAARALPLDLLERDGLDKYALREAAGPLLTATVRRREKHPFLAPPSTARSPRAFAILRDGLARAPEALFDRAALLARADALGTMDDRARTAWDPVLLMALSATVLHHRFGLATP